MALAHKLPNVAPEADDDDPTKVGPGSRRALKAWPDVCAMPVLFDAEDDLEDLDVASNDSVAPKSHTVVMAREPAAPVFRFPTPQPFAPTPAPEPRADIKPFVALAIGLVLGTLMPIATFFLLH
ncbi:MAG TPA: hypothetical protein VIF62_15045 [Labilithrix sp.]